MAVDEALGLGAPTAADPNLQKMNAGKGDSGTTPPPPAADAGTGLQRQAPAPETAASVMTGGNAMLARSMAPQIAAVEQAGKSIMESRARLAAAGRSGDQRAVQAALADLQAQNASLAALLEGNNDAPRIRRALGI